MESTGRAPISKGIVFQTVDAATRQPGALITVFAAGMILRSVSVDDRNARTGICILITLLK